MGGTHARGTRALLQEEIVRVAATCFGEMGYRATTLDTVAGKVGVSKVTLYKHVTSKEALLCRVFDRTIQTFRAGLRHIVEQPVPADEKLRRIIRYQVTLLASHLPFLRVFFSEESGLPAPMARRAAQEKREYDRAIERVVREGIAAGRFRSLPPTPMVFGVLGMCNWLYKWYRPDGALSPDDIATIFIDLLERGYLRHPEAPRGDGLVAGLRRLERGVARIERRLERAGASRTRGSPPERVAPPARVRTPRASSA